MLGLQMWSTWCRRTMSMLLVKNSQHSMWQRCRSIMSEERHLECLVWASRNRSQKFANICSLHCARCCPGSAPHPASRAAQAPAALPGDALPAGDGDRVTTGREGYAGAATQLRGAGELLPVFHRSLSGHQKFRQTCLAPCAFVHITLLSHKHLVVSAELVATSRRCFTYLSSDLCVTLEVCCGNGSCMGVHPVSKQHIVFSRT